MKKLFLLGACLVALALVPAWAQNRKPDKVLVEIYRMGEQKQLITITRPDGRKETFKVKHIFTSLNYTATTGYRRVVTQLRREGYTLTDSIGTGTINIAELVFEKR